MGGTDKQPHSKLLRPRDSAAAVLVRRGVLETVEGGTEGVEPVESHELTARHAEELQPEESAQQPQPRAVDQRRGAQRRFHQLLRGQGERLIKTRRNCVIEPLRFHVHGAQER